MLLGWLFFSGRTSPESVQVEVHGAGGHQDALRPVPAALLHFGGAAAKAHRSGRGGDVPNPGAGGWKRAEEEVPGPNSFQCFGTPLLNDLFWV